MEYNLISVCIGDRYSIIEPFFANRIKERCPNAKIKIIKDFALDININRDYGWWDIVRMNEIIKLLETENKPIVHCDIDVIIEKDIEPLINIKYDIIFSKEFGGINAFPKDCSNKIGFGICTGFYIIKPTDNSIKFLKKIYNDMINKFYGSYSDQITLMNTIVNTDFSIKDTFFINKNLIFTNKIISLKEYDVDICVLDFDLITRDPEYTKNQFANHINIDNVGGSFNFINYYNHKLENLPLTCRCGKFDNTDICNHRKK